MKKRLNKNFTHEIFMSMDKWEDFMCKGYQKWLKIEIEKIKKTSGRTVRSSIPKMAKCLDSG